MQHAQDSEVKVVSLLKCRSLCKLLLWVIFVVSFVFEIGQIMGYPLPQSLQAACPRFSGEPSLSFKMSVIYINYHCRVLL